MFFLLERPDKNMAAALALLLFSCVLLQAALGGRFQVSLPRTMEVLNGSCVTIPCSFDIENRFESNLDQTCGAVWYERSFGGPIAFNSSDPQQSKIKGNLTGDLRSKDCTTTLDHMKPEHSNDYIFRVECRNLKYTYDNLKVQIGVGDHPPRPTLTPSTLKVREGTSVSLRCSAPAPCPSLPPALTWSPGGLGEHQETLQENPDQTKVKTSVVNFTASHLQDRQEISCTAVYSTQGGSTESNSSLTADITYSPKDTTVSVSPSGPVEEDRYVSLTCSSKANPAVKNYTWYRAEGGPEAFIGTGPVFNSQAFKVSGPVFCKAENELGAGNSDTFQLDILRPELSWSSFSGGLVLAAVSLSLSIVNTVCMLLLWKQRKNVKPKEEDKTYATLESSNRSLDYDVIAQRQK